eukprot:scaffold1959_cov243-Pinguiococcus_pyrenoidosus.AAC.2
MQLPCCGAPQLHAFSAVHGAVAYGLWLRCISYGAQFCNSRPGKKKPRFLAASGHDDTPRASRHEPQPNYSN